MIKVGITGASGFIGEHLVAFLRKNESFYLRALTRRNCAAGLYGNFESIQGDLTSAKVCEEFCNGLDVVIHLAHSGGPISSIASFSENTISNLYPTFNLIEAIKKNNTKCKLIYSSSGGAIYANNSLPHKENDICMPNSFYGAQKQMIENYLRIASFHDWLSVIILRISNPYGTLLPSDRMQGIIGIAAQCALNDKDLPIYGNMENVRDYIHLDDVCKAIESAILYKSKFDIFNIGSGIGTSLREVIKLIEEQTNKKINLKIESLNNTDNQLVPWVVIDPSKAIAKLKWSPSISLRDGIRKLCVKHTKA